MYLENASGDLRFNYGAIDPLAGVNGDDNKVTIRTNGSISAVGDPINDQDLATKAYVDSKTDGFGILPVHRIILNADISNLDPIADIIFIRCPNNINRNLNNVKAGYYDGQKLYIIKDDFGTTLTIKFQNSSTDSEGVAGV